MSERMLTRLLVHPDQEIQCDLSPDQREALKHSRSLRIDASERARGRDLFGMGPGYEPISRNYSQSDSY